MRLKILAASIALLFVVAASYTLVPSNATADAPAVQDQEGAPGGLPFTYSGTNGGAQDLTLDFIPSGPAASLQEGANGVPGLGDIVVSGATPGGAGILAVSLAPADVSAFGLSFLIATDPVNLLDFFTYGYDVTGGLFVPNVSQFNPFLSGIDVFIQAYETGPVARTSNGLVFPLL